ncbi:uncharacterized protein LOC111089041 [Limulus polyphemus]|uniref:Uncharacterized protein LOC111089041 n=1 Tax=Limulus polyphemus TaxID=6850 RepID=A0ABM1TKK8_LIMPO|nr:uncharacterized protein LOC111089041 [Limulus polyphemus]
MKLFEKAEELYLQSIEIGLKLFGESYSGLEYDYRGLLQVYTFLGEPQKYMKYQEILQRWNELKVLSTTGIETRFLAVYVRRHTVVPMGDICFADKVLVIFGFYFYNFSLCYTVTKIKNLMLFNSFIV